MKNDQENANHKCKLIYSHIATAGDAILANCDFDSLSAAIALPHSKLAIPSKSATLHCYRSPDPTVQTCNSVRT